MKNPYTLVITILAYFLITSIVGVVLGQFLNDTFNIRPFGSIIGLVLLYALSWVGIYIYVKKTKK